MDLLQGFADISLWQLILVAAVALFASIVGGVTGYGSSALMPLVLVPLVGPEPVVPIVSISGLFNNVTRAFAFRDYIDFKRGLIIMLTAVPSCMAGRLCLYQTHQRRHSHRDRYDAVCQRAASALAHSHESPDEQ